MVIIHGMYTKKHMDVFYYLLFNMNTLVCVQRIKFSIIGW